MTQYDSFTFYNTSQPSLAKALGLFCVVINRLVVISQNRPTGLFFNTVILEEKMTTRSLEKKITVKKIIEWQNNVISILPRNPGAQHGHEINHLRDEQWDMLPHGLTWQTASKAEAERAIRFFGPAAFRVLRWSHIPRELPPKIHILGGACLMTNADREHIANTKTMPSGEALNGDAVRDIQSITAALPSLTQVNDGILGLAAPECTERRLLYVSEDNLFTEQTMKMFGADPECADVVNQAFCAEGERAEQVARQYSLLASKVSYESRIVSFGQLDELIRAGVRALVETEEFERATKRNFHNTAKLIEVMTNLERALVMYSYTEHFFHNVLVPAGLTDSDALWVIAEPFHHFSHMPMKSRSVFDSHERVGVMYQATADYFTSQPYGGYGSANKNVVLVATLPALTHEGLAFSHQPTSLQPCVGSQDVFIEQLEESVTTEFNLAHPVLQAAANIGWFDPEVRKVVNELLPTANGMVEVIRLLKKSMPKSRDMTGIRMNLIDGIRQLPIRNGEIKERLQFLVERISQIVDASMQM